MHLLNESNEQVRVVQGCKWHFLIISVKHLPLVESDRIALQTTEKKLLLTPLLSSLPGNSYRPDMSLLAGTPCWDPRFWQSGSRGSSCSVRCGWTLRRRWMRWFQKRMNGCLDPLALQTLKEKDKGCISLVYPDWNEVFIQLWIHSGGNNVVITAALLSKTKKKKSIRKVTLWVLALKEKKKADIDRQRNKGWIPPPPHKVT